MKITVEIDNINEAQAIALEDYFAKMVQLGNLGSSRWLAFFSEGNGSFRPKIKVNGKDANHTDIVDTKKYWGKMDEIDVYKMDFDEIDWLIDDPKYMKKIYRKRKMKKVLGKI
jgi:hypothetical protein